MAMGEGRCEQNGSVSMCVCVLDRNDHVSLHTSSLAHFLLTDRSYVTGVLCVRVCGIMLYHCMHKSKTGASSVDIKGRKNTQKIPQVLGSV